MAQPTQRDLVRIGGETKPYLNAHIKMCSGKLGLKRKIRGEIYNLWGAGTTEWADHNAKQIRARGGSAVSIPFADPDLHYKAVYVKGGRRK